jgi:hypothetical protein
MERRVQLTPMPSHTSSSRELSGEDFERYPVGRIRDKAELTRAERHLSGCPACAQRGKAMAGYIYAMREALQRFDNQRAAIGRPCEAPSTVPTE